MDKGRIESIKSLYKNLPDKWECHGGGKESYRIMTSAGPMRVQVHGLDNCKEVSEFIEKSRDIIPELVDVIEKKNLENFYLKEEIRKAAQYLKEGKKLFAPNTTNSFVDEFIEKWRDK